MSRRALSRKSLAFIEREQTPQRPGRESSACRRSAFVHRLGSFSLFGENTDSSVNLLAI
jgi:hypothetical protein